MTESCDTCLYYGTLVTLTRHDRIALPRHDPCPTCHGEGQLCYPDDDPPDWVTWPTRADTEAMLAVQRLG